MTFWQDPIYRGYDLPKLNLMYFIILVGLCFQNRHEVASTMHRSDTIERLKSFNARRKLKVGITGRVSFNDLNLRDFI